MRQIPQRPYESMGRHQFTWDCTSPIIFTVKGSRGLTIFDDGAFEVKRLRLYAADDKSMVMKVRR